MTAPDAITAFVVILFALVAFIAIRDWRAEQRRDRREYFTDFEEDGE